MTASSTLSGEKDTEFRNSWVRLGKVGFESDGFGTQDIDAKQSLSIQPFHAQCSVSCVAIWGKGGDGGGTLTRNRLNWMPPGFG